MITANYNDYADGGSHKDFEISIVGEQTVIDNSKMLSESIRLEEALCSEQNLKFGACEASQFTVQVANTAGNFKGKTLEVAVTMDETTTKYGTFKVQSDKPTADRIWRVLTAYDKMYDIINADVLDWYSSLTFPMTLANFRNSFFTYLGVTQKSTTLINDSFAIQGGFTATGALSGKTIINAICEFNGVFGHINRDREFEYISLDGADSFNCPPYENNSVTYEDYVTEAITKVTMKGSVDDVGTSVGTDGNEYVIINNPLIYGTEGTQALVTAITNLLNKISQITYRPYALNKTIGNPCVELGDAIVISTKYQTINSYVIKRVLSGIQALRDNYSATGDKTYPKEVNSIQSQINRIDGKTNELSITVEETKSVVTSLNRNAIVTDALHYLATPLSSGVTTQTQGWTTTPQSMTPTNKYLWTYHTYAHGNESTTDTAPVITGVYGEDGEPGEQGEPGEPGPAGVGISEVVPLYFAKASNVAPDAPTSNITTDTDVQNDWTRAIPTLSTSYPYLFTCDQIKYEDNTYSWSPVVMNNAMTELKSTIDQLAGEIVLKVDNNGRIVQIALDGSGSSSHVLIKGDDIQLDGNVTITSGFVLNVGTIQSANYVANTQGMKITLSDGALNSKNFKIDSSGNVLATNLYATNIVFVDSLLYNWNNNNYYFAKVDSTTGSFDIYDKSANKVICISPSATIIAGYKHFLYKNWYSYGDFAGGTSIGILGNYGGNPDAYVIKLSSDSEGGQLTICGTSRNWAIDCYDNASLRFMLSTGTWIRFASDGTVRFKSNTRVAVGSYNDSTFTLVNDIIKITSSNYAILTCGSSNYSFAIASWSDSALKKNVKDSQVNALDIINTIKMREFDFKEKEYGTHEDIGYVANELVKIIPEAVVEVPISDEDKEKYGKDTLYQVNDGAIVKYLVKAVQELSNEVKRLKNGGKEDEEL